MENWFKLEFIVTKKLNITPLELDMMEFYRVEYLIQNYEEYVEEQNKEYDKQKKDGDISLSKSQSQYSSPKFQQPQMNMPSLSVPQLSVPKL